VGCNGNGRFGAQNTEDNSSKEIHALVNIVVQHLGCIGDDGQPRNPIGWVKKINAEAHTEIQPRGFVAGALVGGSGFTKNIVKSHSY
jgi:hypothetical protein